MYPQIRTPQLIKLDCNDSDFRQSKTFTTRVYTAISAVLTNYSVNCVIVNTQIIVYI